MSTIAAAMLVVVLAGVSGCGHGKPRTIVCLGDSLTACGGDGGRYSDWLAKHLPADTFINKGVNGDTLAGGRARFERDVLDLHADVVIITLGANDYWRQDRSINALKADLSWMVQRARTAGMEVVIASCFGRPSGWEPEPEQPQDEDKKGQFAVAIGRMERHVSRRYGCFHVPNMQVDIKPNGREPYWSDQNHPNKRGNELVAKRILPELLKALK